MLKFQFSTCKAEIVNIAGPQQPVLALQEAMEHTQDLWSWCQAGWQRNSQCLSREAETQWEAAVLQNKRKSEEKREWF